MKKKKLVDMNKNLKRAIYKKRMSFNKYNRCKNKQNWEIYRKQKFGEQNKKTIHQKLFD
jgi:ribosomal protein S4